MSTRDDTQIAVRVSHELAREVDEMRRDEGDIPTRVEMIRRLILREAARRRGGQARQQPAEPLSAHV